MKRIPPPTRDSRGTSPTGIAGFDEITGGGLPRGRTTLVVGGVGSGKTLLAKADKTEIYSPIRMEAARSGMLCCSA